jgi:lipid-binding SYLF domain-containing protein
LASGGATIGAAAAVAAGVDTAAGASGAAARAGAADLFIASSAKGPVAGASLRNVLRAVHTQRERESQKKR